MPKEKIQTVRALARELGVSHTTVSDALRNNPRVSVKTRERVQRAARELGYHYNPLAGAIMSEIRRSSVGTFHGIVAIVDLESDKDRRPGAKPYHAEMLRGARDAAGRLGFKVDYFILGEEHIPVSRLNGILESRGIHAALFLPVSGKPEISEFNWEYLTGIYTDYLIDDPALHTVCPDHFRSMTIALQKLIDLGYTRPGLVLRESQDRRTLFRWEAAFSSYWSRHTDHDLTIPLVTKDLTRDTFLEWFDATKPDVVMSHHASVLQWMKERGCKVPETHGFCCLNVVSAQINAAGLDLLPRLAGMRGMEALVAQLQRNEYGIPEAPSTMTYAAKWQDGPTLRKQ
ncbi:MAG: LacI family DNA-binding transcriptional regulator [Puniceicoccaceae bacterium]